MQPVLSNTLEVTRRNVDLNRGNHDFLTGRATIKRLGLSLSEHLGKPVLIRPQVSNLAYLLGHGEGDTSILMPKIFTRDILPSIPRRGIISLSRETVEGVIKELSDKSCGDQRTRKYCGDSVYIIGAVEEAMKAMDLNLDLLQYTPDGFAKALELVSG